MLASEDEEKQIPVLRVSFSCSSHSMAFHEYLAIHLNRWQVTIPGLAAVKELGSKLPFMWFGKWLPVLHVQRRKGLCQRTTERGGTEEQRWVVGLLIRTHAQEIRTRWNPSA